ncbi:hypothetical protein B0H15DRAFT_948246 [Mycena belliarum]|uniref:Uncharacterized protein n=1 Tax=Mycena belliarum TaxID=1033014 RepID=A0AAD6U5W4_9AGAR|nr:hypothetical protein B0H15DRAFT_948246 [Mycena belliae]
MARGRKPMDPDQKRQHREAALAKYAEKNAERLRNAGRLRMRRIRATLADADQATVNRHKRNARKSATKYREGNRDKICFADTERRAERREAGSYSKATEQVGETLGAGDALAARPEFEVTAPPVQQHECRAGCGEWACEGCACICTASTSWVAHEHYRTDAWRAAGCP